MSGVGGPLSCRPEPRNPATILRGYLDRIIPPEHRCDDWDERFNDMEAFCEAPDLLASLASDDMGAAMARHQFGTDGNAGAL